MCASCFNTQHISCVQVADICSVTLMKQCLNKKAQGAKHQYLDTHCNHCEPSPRMNHSSQGQQV
jgi:hypothetical protein